MHKGKTHSTLVVLIVGALTVLSAGRAGARDDIIDFESDAWNTTNGRIVEHLDRKCLVGMAILEGVEFENGVIEFDVALTERQRSYPAILFRMQSPGEYEEFYIRGHRIPLYSDALQYTPVFNSISCWQLYNGDGLTAATDIPWDEWVHVRLEVHGSQARVFVGEGDGPALVVRHLRHGVSKGGIGLRCRTGGGAYFSDFSYRPDDSLEFLPVREIETPPGMIEDWQISKPYGISQLDLELHPDQQDLTGIEWQDATIEPTGLVNVGRYFGRLGREPDCVFARATIHSDKQEMKQYSFGYSDWIAIFLNGELLFTGNSAYQKRDPSFLGIIGLNDVIYLPLKEGDNELVFTVAESFGGWGFMCQDGEAVFEHESVSKEWETADSFKIPECVVFDEDNRALYISNYDAYNYGPARGMQSISKLLLDGTVQNLDWVTGISNPTGMTVSGGKLYVVERTAVVEIDTESSEILTRHPLPGDGFPNDIAIDPAGNMYVSDSRKSAIYRSTGGSFEEWLSGGEIGDPNGLCVHQGRLLVGNNADGRIKAIDLGSGEVSTVVDMSGGIIDGLKVSGKGDLMVSHWEGRVYKVSPAGDVTKILDTSVPGTYCADFEYIGDEGLLVVPTFIENQVHAYRVTE